MTSASESSRSATTSIPVPHRLAPDAVGPRVEFTWQGDRYAHVISGSDDEAASRWCSQEGSADEDWPSSAAIQQLSTEVIEGRETILGVGCCGTTHFSVSVQHEKLDDDSLALRFDWAARLSKPLPSSKVDPEGDNPTDAFLGSTYQPRRDDSTSASDLRTLEFESLGDAMLDKTPSDDTTQIRPDRITGSRTIVWSYQVKLSPPID